jgi:6-phosphogluconolactonase
MDFHNNIFLFDDIETLSLNAFDIFKATAIEAIKKKGRFFTALSGGKTPLMFYLLLANLKVTPEFDWEEVEIFWSDERYVDCNSDLSNYKLAADAFLNKVNIPPQNIHRMPTELGDINKTAKEYDKDIAKTFDVEGLETPCFDLIILGVGTDGHIASLFPKSVSIYSKFKYVSAVTLNGQQMQRISFNKEIIQRANKIMVMAAGQEKAEIFKNIFKNKPNEDIYPVHILWPVLHKTIWLLDKQSGSSIENLV